MPPVLTGLANRPISFSFEPLVITSQLVKREEIGAPVSQICFKGFRLIDILLVSPKQIIKNSWATKKKTLLSIVLVF